MKSPKPNKRTNHHKPHKMQLMLASKKLLQRKNKQSPQPDGVKKRKPKVEHNHMPTNPSQCSRNTKQHSNKYAFHILNRHTPTNKPTKRLIGRQTNQHTTMHTKNKKYIGTLLSSQTSSPHNIHTLSHVYRREQKIYFVRACFPIAASARNFLVPVGRCRSR